MELDDKERQLMIEVIDQHVLGIEDAKEATTLDPTMESAEQMLDHMALYDDDIKTLSNVREKLTDD